MASDPTSGPPHPAPPPQEAAPRDPRRDERDGERRVADRRRSDRRTPPPWWRSPWAMVSYGVLGALALVGLFGAMREKPEPVLTGTLTPAPVPGAPPATTPDSSRTPAAPPQEASDTRGFERLVIEGQAAVGRRVRTELYCDAPSPVALTPPARGEPEPAVAALAVSGRVPGALCKWGRHDDPRREDFLLLVPPGLASTFAGAPLVNDDFVQRRHLFAEVEWIGRSPSLALRTVGILRGVSPAGR